ncbi:acetyl-CoA synthetase [Candidatus Woesearchaeota archaeon]|nr:MAG: acetyl-CoA synthetase [Candidatus Woesearchaeota archaeon]
MKLLDQDSTLKLLKKYKIPIAKSKVCKNLEECKKFSKQNGFPVAVKIDSPDIVHKSDVGAVKIGINNETDLKKAYTGIISNCKKFKKDFSMNGMLIQKQYDGHNLLVGMKRDATFGPVIVFGIGGVTVELLKDVSRKIAPITKTQAKEMVKEIKMYKILEGYRGEKGAHIDSLVSILLKLSMLSMENEKVMEIDFNPIISNDKKSVIVDARVMIK